MNSKLGAALLRETHKIHFLDGSKKLKVSLLHDLLINICKEAVKDTGIQFHTVFAVLAYTGHKFRLPGKFLFNLHRFRRQARSIHVESHSHESIEYLYLLGVKVLVDLIRLIYSAIPSPELIALTADPAIYHTRDKRIVSFEKSQRVLIVKKQLQSDLLIGIDRAAPDKPILIRYNVEGRNENFNSSIDLLDSTLQLPLEVNLIDVEIDAEGVHEPKAFVLEPDYLIDITAVAECFKEFGVSYLPYLSKKYLPLSNNKYLMLGHIANFFLDELMADSSLSFKELIGQVFQLNPLAFSLFDDSMAREIVQLSQRHFISLKTVIQNVLPKHGISVEHCFLEPTFYSEQFGLQGRLDVLHDHPEIEEDAAIIELKSGKPFKPNAYGLSHNHYVQTLLYDLLIKSVSRGKLRPTNYILYSIKDRDHLRFAPAVRSQQYEALNARNALIGFEHLLSEVDQHLDQPANFISIIKGSEDRAYGFVKRDIELIENRFRQISVLEQKYFLVMSAFAAREQRLSKVGMEGQNRNNGQASLWLNSMSEKEAEFNILSHLIIEEDSSHLTEPLILFKRTDKTNPLANFRQGDLAILYPGDDGDNALDRQLFKGSIIQLTEESITFKLRAKQFNHSLFKKYTFWNLEHDVLDSSFSGLYRSLFAFIGFEGEARRKFLTLKAPKKPKKTISVRYPELTEEQNHVFNQMLNAEDYYLLWGPPGTGKTSVMLRLFVKYLMLHTKETILLLAYTNRAVDEICTAIKSTEEGFEEFIRIGSRYSTDPAHRANLLNEKIAKVQKRSELKRVISSHRIVAATISSIIGKREIFELMKFDRVVVDEATQILEPMMAGLLPYFEKTLLIGDHKQLAAVVVQAHEERTIEDPGLHAIGANDVGDSYFERVFRRCQEENWYWAFNRLSHQGRMHQDIMEFPSTHFYQGMLKVLPAKQPSVQTELIQLRHPTDPDHFLIKQRVAFLPVPSGELFNSKTNAGEARIAACLVQELASILSYNNRAFTSSTLGVITPYRAQIAMIRQELWKRDFDPSNVTIDTVERYQGGARDIIIISLCVNSTDQLDSLVSHSSEGVDRKLNVALTRAREQLIVLGDTEVLSSDPTYAAFIDRYRLEEDAISSLPVYASER
ncbi:MAG: AAA domain-containing protein [Saprospiraceae bacterium]|nr:AAA domain-containing protein [Saprospiraceae bacterium]